MYLSKRTLKTEHKEGKQKRLKKDKEKSIWLQN